MTNEDFETLKTHFTDYLLGRFGKSADRGAWCLDAEVAVRAVQTHLTEFLAQLHVRHLTGSILSPEDLFEEFDDLIFAKVARTGYNPPRPPLGRDDDLLRNVFGAHVTIELCLEAVRQLFKERRAHEYQILTEFFDQCALRTTIGPTPHSVSAALHRSTFSEDEVSRTLLRFADRLWKQREH